MKPEIKCLHTEVWPLDKFREHPKNPNRHPDAQLDILAQVILKAGWRNPVVVSSRSGFVVKGHGRLAAASRAGFTEAPVEIQDYASEATELADLVADNRIAELSERDQFAVHGVLSELNEMGSDLLAQTGFTADDFKVLDAEIEAGMAAPAVKLPTARAASTRKANTLFYAGPFRFEISREAYLRWHTEIRSKVGFEKKNIVREIKSRIGMKHQAIK